MTRGASAAGGDLLRAVVAATERRVEVRRQAQPAPALERLAAAAAPRAALFADALARPDAVNVIAECKRRSPSRGVIRPRYDPAAIARSYERHGAAAISVLTEPTFFDGALDHLRAVRDAVQRPVLRKDFIVSACQLLEARAAGADAVLLIVAALAQPRLRELIAETARLGLAALVEVHDGGELQRALDAGAAIVGVNARNLRTLDVDPDLAGRLAAAIPDGVTAVAESGLRSAADLQARRAAGYDAFLIGESLMREADPGEALGRLLAGAGRPAAAAPGQP